jgi:hypothetical protein
MFYPITAFTTDAVGTQYEHIVYVGKNGHLQDIARKRGGSWQYNADITAAANVTAQELDQVQSGFANPVPNALGAVGANIGYLNGSYAPQIFYYGADYHVHAIFPVNTGFFWPARPGQPGDEPEADCDLDDDPADPDDPGGICAFIYDADDPDTSGSPAGWSDVWLSPGTSGPPVGAYQNVNDANNTTVVYGNNGGLYGVYGNVSAWGSPVAISSLAVSSNSSYSPPTTTNSYLQGP